MNLSICSKNVSLNPAHFMPRPICVVVYKDGVHEFILHSVLL